MNSGNRSSLELDNDESALVLVELAIVLPLFVFLSFIGLEFGRSLKFVEAASSISREASSQAFRKCIGKYRLDPKNNPDAATEVEVCLEQVRVGLEEFAEAQFPGTAIVLTLLRYDDTPSNPDCSGNLSGDSMTIVGRSGGNNKKHQSKIQLGTGDLGGLVDATSGNAITGGLEKRTICLNRAVIVAEAFIPFTSITGTRNITMLYDPGDSYSVSSV